MEIIGSTWYTQMGNREIIGIVIVRVQFTERAFIGTAMGTYQSEDEEHIAATGAEFPLGAAKDIIGM
jgi:hypothetical protein